MNFFQWRRENGKPADPRGAVEAPDVANDRPIPAEAERADDDLPGDRGIPSINRVRSVQSRLKRVLAIGLIGALGLGLLGWYYQRMFEKPAQSRESAQAALKRRSQAEMPLPRLPRVPPPRIESLSAEASGPLDTVLGPPPELPPEHPAEWEASTSPGTARAAKSAEQLGHERRLAGPVFAARDTVKSAGQGGDATHIYGAAGDWGCDAWSRRGRCPQHSAVGLGPRSSGESSANADARCQCRGAADAAPAAAQGRISRLHARDRDRLDACPA